MNSEALIIEKEHYFSRVQDNLEIFRNKSQELEKLESSLEILQLAHNKLINSDTPISSVSIEIIQNDIIVTENNIDELKNEIQEAKLEAKAFNEILSKLNEIG